jgi:hypothetical protein
LPPGTTYRNYETGLPLLEGQARCPCTGLRDSPSAAQSLLPPRLAPHSPIPATLGRSFAVLFAKRWKRGVSLGDGKEMRRSHFPGSFGYFCPSCLIWLGLQRLQAGTSTRISRRISSTQSRRWRALPLRLGLGARPWLGPAWTWWSWRGGALKHAQDLKEVLRLPGEEANKARTQLQALAQALHDILTTSTSTSTSSEEERGSVGATAMEQQGEERTSEELRCGQ